MARTHNGFSQISGRSLPYSGADHDGVRVETARTRLRHRLAFAVGPTLLLAMGVTVVASAQSSSPFANKKKVNAWELPQAGVTTPAPTQTSATPQPTSAPVLRGLRTSTPSAASVPTPTPVRTQTQSAPAATVSAPPAQTQTQVSTQASTQASTQVATQASNQVQTTTQTSAVPSPNYTYSGQTASTTVTRPQTTYQGTSRNWTLGQGGPVGQIGVPTGPSGPMAHRSVSSSQTPSQAINNPDADYRVHELPGRPRSVPQQPGGYGSGLAGGQPYAGNGAAGGAYGNQSVQGRSVQGRSVQGQAAPQSQRPTAYDYGYGQPSPNSTGSYQQGGYQQGAYQEGSYQQGAYGQGAYPADPNATPRRRGFLDRIGLGALSTLIRGGLRGGVAARDSNGWEEAFVGDADLEVEVSAITQGGLEWGIHTQVRAQYDEGRKGFVRRLPDCPPTTLGCPSIAIPGALLPASVRGHTSQHYSWGPDVAKDTQFALESAHLFLRSAYGDVTIGRDDGAAYLFSLGAPTLMNVGASNSPVDYTGLDAVKTLNDASGFSEKLTYTSPRLLGDQVGVGVQLGVSYAPNSSACGVDYCVDLNDITDVVSPDVQDVMEAGLALDRTLAPGVSVEGTLTYARGSEKSGLTGLDDLQSFGAGLEFKMNQWTLGGSWLSSNQGLMSGDYEAFDIGLTWQPSKLGFTLAYGHATDDLVGLSSDQIVGGVSYDLNDRVRFGAGVQHADRETLRDVAGTAQLGSEKATALFIEGGITF